MLKIRKITIIITFVLSIILVLSLLFIQYYVNSQEKEENSKLSYSNTSIFKLEFCDGTCNEDNPYENIKAKYKCQICRRFFTHPTTDVPMLCENCAKSTQKHAYCGKYLNYTDDE